MEQYLIKVYLRIPEDGIKAIETLLLHTQQIDGYEIIQTTTPASNELEEKTQVE